MKEEHRDDSELLSQLQNRLEGKREREGGREEGWEGREGGKEKENSGCVFDQCFFPSKIPRRTRFRGEGPG